MKTIYFFTAITLLFIFASCRKEAGKPANLNNGLITQSGTSFTTASGSTLYIGSTLPSLTIGAVGDFYLDVTNGMVYGPKTSTDWGKGYPLKGPIGATGSAGAAGSKIYGGTGVPDPTLGAVGDYYIDKTAGMLYGPKTATGWGTPLSIVGPQGPQGPVGPNSVQVDTFTVKGSDWLWNSQYVFETSPGSYTEYFTRYYVRSNNTVTQNLLNSGMVLVYFTPSPVNNANQWEPLPYQFDSSFGYTYNYVYVTAVGQVTLHYFFIQTSSTATLPTLSTYNDETRRFKIVTVSGQTGVFMQANHINLNDYQAVSRATGLWQHDK
jgi:hypothetical protein